MRRILIFILPLFYYSCEEIVSDIDALTTQNAEQDAQIDSLITVLTEQQEYIDSLNNVQNVADSLNNLVLHSYIDSLILASIGSTTPCSRIAIAEKDVTLCSDFKNS